MSKLTVNAIHASAVNFSKIVLQNIRTMEKHRAAYEEFVAAQASLESAKNMFRMATDMELNDVVKIHVESNTNTNKKGSDVTKRSYTATVKSVEEISAMISEDEAKPTDSKREIVFETKPVEE